MCLQAEKGSIRSFKVERNEKARWEERTACSLPFPFSSAVYNRAVEFTPSVAGVAILCFFAEEGAAEEEGEGAACG